MELCERNMLELLLLNSMYMRPTVQPIICSLGFCFVDFGESV